MIKLIQTATTSEFNEERTQAEKAIVDLRQQNPQQFFVQAMEVFANKQAPTNVRQASGTLISVSLLNKSKTGGYIWDVINGNTKNVIKNSNLELLIDNDRTVRRAAANIVSAICLIELPRNQWEGIVEKICFNISHENQIVKQSSILTLGFICSRMKDRSDFAFTNQIQDSILSGILLGIQQTQPHLIDTSLKALRDSIPSLTLTLANTQYRTFLLGQLANIVGNQTYRVDGLQIIGQFVKVCYQYLKDYMDGLVTLLTPIITQSQDQQASIAAMEIWESMAAQYKDLSQNPNNNLPNFISGQYGISIVTLLLKNLAIMEDSEDSDENPVSDSASKALETIFQNGSEEYKDLVLQFVRVSISQPNWKNRQASIKAFSLLLYGLPDQISEILISGSINELMGLLGDTSKQVQFAALDSLVIITEVAGKIILKSANFLQYLKLILSKLDISQKFLRTGCKIVDNLCQAQKQSKNQRFSAISQDLINFFLKFALDGNSTLAVINWTTSTIMNIIEVAYNQTVINKYLIFILQNIDNIKQVNDAQKRSTLTSSFFTIMQFCLHGLVGTQLDKKIIQTVYTKVVNSFKLNNDVNTDGFYVIQALVYYFEGNKAILNDFWGYVTHALSKWQDPTMFKATASCISSFLNCYKQDFGPEKIQTFVPGLIDLLENPSFNKQLKLDCLVVLGEVFLCCRNQAQKYLQKFLQVILLCCSASVQMTDTEFAYSEQLKDTIIQTLMCILHGLNTQTQVNQQIAPYVPNFFQFIMVTCSKKCRPTVTYLKRCILLMSDFAKFYPKVVQPIKQQPFIGQCISTLKSFNTHNQHNSAIKYASMYLK